MEEQCAQQKQQDWERNLTDNAQSCLRRWKFDLKDREGEKVAEFFLEGQCAKLKTRMWHKERPSKRWPPGCSQPDLPMRRLRLLAVGDCWSRRLPAGYREPGWRGSSKRTSTSERGGLKASRRLQFFSFFLSMSGIRRGKATLQRSQGGW